MLTHDFRPRTGTRGIGTYSCCSLNSTNVCIARYLRRQATNKLLIKAAAASNRHDRLEQQCSASVTSQKGVRREY